MHSTLLLKPVLSTDNIKPYNASKEPSKQTSDLQIL